MFGGGRGGGSGSGSGRRNGGRLQGRMILLFLDDAGGFFSSSIERDGLTECTTVFLVDRCFAKGLATRCLGGVSSRADGVPGSCVFIVDLDHCLWLRRWERPVVYQGEREWKRGGKGERWGTKKGTKRTGEVRARCRW